MYHKPRPPGHAYGKQVKLGEILHGAGVRTHDMVVAGPRPLVLRPGHAELAADGEARAHGQAPLPVILPGPRALLRRRGPARRVGILLEKRPKSQ